MPDEIIFGPWVGSVTSTSATIKAAVTNGVRVELVVSQAGGTGAEIEAPPAGLSVDGGTVVATFNVIGLQPNQRYHYALKINDAVVAESGGRFRTFPSEDVPASFIFACAGDAKGGGIFSGYSNHEVFDEIRAEDPLFFIHLGDLHYADIDSRKVSDHVESYREVLQTERQARLYREVPLAYVWDDHDYCGNASNGQSKGRKAARLAYQRCVPHYPLVEGTGDVPIYQAFTVGRVRFLLTDLRSERSPRNTPDGPGKTILGERQKEWLKTQLLEGKNNPLVVWVSSVPWIGDPEEEGDDSDDWFSYASERDELGEFIEKNNISNLLMLAADAHMIAIDDGSNNREPTGGGGFPVFHASPLDRPNSVKGKPYSHGIFVEGRGQYGLVNIEDSGGAQIKVTLKGKRKQAELVSFCFDSPR